MDAIAVPSSRRLIHRNCYTFDGEECLDLALTACSSWGAKMMKMVGLESIEKLCQ